MPACSSLLARNVWRKSARIGTALITLALISACASDKPDPTGLNPSVGALSSGIPVAERPASSVWQATARQFVGDSLFIPIRGGHAYPLLGVAQYLAVQRAEAASGANANTSPGKGIGAGGRPYFEIDRGAVAGASAVVMSYLFKGAGQQQAIAAMLLAQENGSSRGLPHDAFMAGEAIGRAVGAAIVERATHDQFSSSTPLTTRPQIGAGYWISNTDPFTVNGGQLPGVVPWFLWSASQFRPGPPPAFGSADYLNALQAIRDFSDNPTQAHKDIAAFWALGGGTETASGFWLARASDEIAQRGLSEREATHLYALLSATIADAQIGCWDAKLFYWVIRPWQADTHITPFASVGRPNHPSYPSGHSCVSSSAGEVLSTWFPEKRAHFEAMVAEAGFSREVSGIHYHFDVVAGQELGRNVAIFTIGEDAKGTSVLTAH
jgi:membrane-associated phospholipid phosphatase